MSCTNPRHMYQVLTPNANGKRPLVSTNPHGKYIPIDVPCGNCDSCRLTRSQFWAIRIMHEASLHPKNIVITLTYAPEHLPPLGSLLKSDFQKFMKRLRKAYPDKEIRFFHCGEYGAIGKRPHYHACIFNFDFDDKKPWRPGNSGSRQWKSETLTRIWGKGIAQIGDLDNKSAAYIARYILKKVNGPSADNHYMEYDLSSGEIHEDRKPEYITMSNRPGIGSKWFDKFGTDVYGSFDISTSGRDEVVFNHRKVKPPPYYDRLLERINPDKLQAIKAERVRKAELKKLDYTDECLNVKSVLKKQIIQRLKRELE